MENVMNVKTLTFILGFSLIVIGAVNSTIGNVAGGTSCFAMAVVTLILFHFDVKSFKVFGLAAELRDKINEADIILDKLRGISTPVSEMAVTTATQVGKYGFALPRMKLYKYANSITEQLEAMDVPSDEIERVKESWYLATAIEMSIPIHREIRYRIDSNRSRILKRNDELSKGKLFLNEKEEKELCKQIADIEEDAHDYYGEEGASVNLNYKSYPEYFMGIIKGLRGVPENEKAEMLDKVNENILDLEYLIIKGDIRRPDSWFN